MCYEDTAGQHVYGIALGLRAWNEKEFVDHGESFASSTNSIAGVPLGNRLNTLSAEQQFDLYDQYVNTML